MANIPTIKTEKMTIEEFVRLQHTEGPFEIIEGERIAKMPTVAGHNFAANKIYKLIMLYLLEKPIGEVFIEATFILPDTYDSNWVIGSRIPDVMFVNAQKLEAYKQQDSDWKTKPFVMVPDLIIEVVSPNDTFSAVHDKANLYLQDGAQIVWVIDPQQKCVLVYESNNKPIIPLYAGDTLTGGDVLPGFSISIETIFV